MNDPVKEFKALKRKKDSDEALQILKRLASQVKPILIKRHWTIKNLCEFFPTNPNLLGVNVNRGWKINLRLRPHFDDNQFLEYEDILGTLLHEMAHIVHGPHDERFYKLLDELKLETETLIASGYRGEGFYSDGHELGSRSVPRYMANQVAAAAAEKRQKISSIMLPAGGRRLGGSATGNKTPAQLAALAAQKRWRDQVWCGGSVEEEHEGSSSPQADGKRKNVSDDMTSRDRTAVKKTRVETSQVVDLTSKDQESAKWACASCTFLNKPIVLVCEMCLSERPIHPSATIENDTQAFWKCPQCTLLNENKWQACTACSYVYLR